MRGAQRGPRVAMAVLLLGGAGGFRVADVAVGGTRRPTAAGRSAVFSNPRRRLVTTLAASPRNTPQSSRRIAKGTTASKVGPLGSTSGGGAMATTQTRAPKSKERVFFWDRKRVLRALTSLDQGEFRWELLTPWVRDRALTRVDKVVICMTFILIAVALQNVLEPRTALPQHLSYVLNFFSYTIGNQVGYRLIAILASLLEIAAYDDAGGFVLAEDGIPDGYNALFIVVNLYYVMRWMLNRIDAIAGVLDPLEEELFSRCFEPLGVGPYQYLKLLDLAEFVRPTQRTPLTVEGEPVEELFVSIAGDFDVKTNGYRVASIPPFQIIGEVAALENLQSPRGDFHQAARATVLAEAGSLYVKWTHAQLFALQASDAEFARAIRLAIARTLSHKLGSARRSAGKLVSAKTKQERAEETTALENASENISPTSLAVSSRAAADEDVEDALRVLPVVAPEQERIYTACFLRRGFEDPQAFATLVRLAGPKRSTVEADDGTTGVVGAPPGGAAASAATADKRSGAVADTVDAPPPMPVRSRRRVVRVSLDGGQRLFALSRGRASVYDEAGVRVQSIAAPQLVGVESFLESLIVFNGALSSRPPRRAKAAEPSSSSSSSSSSEETPPSSVPELLTVHVEPNSDFFLWNLRDVAPTVRADPALRAALNRLYLTTVRDAPQKAAAIVSEQQALRAEDQDDDARARRRRLRNATTAVELNPGALLYGEF